MPDNKYHKLVHDLYQHLGSWLQSQTWHRLRTSYERKGRERFHDGMPLDQLVFALTETKAALIDFVRGSAQGDSSERDLELELLLAVSAFFDRAIYHTVRGFEDARMTAAKNPAPPPTKQRRRTSRERQMDDDPDLFGHARQPQRRCRRIFGLKSAKTPRGAACGIRFVFTLPWRAAPPPRRAAPSGKRRYPR